MRFCREGRELISVGCARLVYCRTAGVDPNSHPVLQELVSCSSLPLSLSLEPIEVAFSEHELIPHFASLDATSKQLRLKSYFDKLKNAEEPVVEKGASLPPLTFLAPNRSLTHPSPPPARPQLDKAAATRFINAAISSSRPRTPVDYTPTAGPSTPQELGEKGTHTRFDEGDVERLLESEGESSESEEEVVVLESKKQEKKGGKQARPKMDPFAGTFPLFSR